MSQLLDFISEQISSEQVDSIASRLGATREQTENALSMAVPTLVGAMARKAESDQGADELHRQLSIRPLAGQAASGHEAAGMLDSLTSALGASGLGGSAMGGSGNNPLGDLLGGLLGQRKDKVENGIGKASGLSAAQVSSMLAMLAPLVLGAVAKKSSTSSGGGFDLGSLTSMLRNEKKSMENQATGGLLAGLLDQDGDGDFDFKDIMQIGMKRLFGSRNK